MKLKPEIVELFRKVVEERDKNALFELAKEYRSEIVAALMGLLDRRQRDWVFNAVWALRELKAVEALPKLRRLARQAGPHLREYCQKVIAELEEFSRLPRAVGVGEIELANLPAIPDTSAIPTENLPRAVTPEEKPDRAAMP
jgi:3-polyprenyl-4-hydroxybenzoate decarboxylase